MIHQEPAPLEALIKNTPSAVVGFLDGTASVREVLSARSNAHGLLLAPLRGAMPIVWSLLGDEAVEVSNLTHLHILEMPLGIFHYERTPGKTQATSPTTEQKHAIVEHQLRHTEGRTIHDYPRIILLDEVQKGGTLTTATKLVRKVLSDLGHTSPMHVIAAQDSRVRIMREPKAVGYADLAQNNLRGVLSTIIPMPLVCTDKDPLLDTITLKGRFRDSYDIVRRLTVTRNERAEFLLRGLGSIARTPDLRHDQAYLDSIIESQGTTDEKTAGRLEVWLPNLISILDSADK